MTKEYRLHPVFVILDLSSKIRHGIVPFLGGIASLRFLGDVSISTLAWIGIGFVACTLASSLIRHFTFRFRYGEADFVTRSGLFFRKERHVPYARIQHLDSTQNVVHRFFRIVTVELQTGGWVGPEAKLHALPLPAFERLRTQVREARTSDDPSPQTEVQPEPLEQPDSGTLLHLKLRELVHLGLIQYRGLVVASGALAVAQRNIDRWLNLDADGWLSRQYRSLRYGDRSGGIGDGVQTDPGEEFGSLIESWTGQTSALATLDWVILLFGLAVIIQLLSVCWAIFRYHDYRLFRVGESLRTTSGLFTRFTTTVPSKRIQAVSVHHNPLYRLTGRVIVSLRSAEGPQMQDTIPQKQRVAPILKTDRQWSLLREIFSAPTLGEPEWKSVSEGAFRRLFVRTAFWITLAMLPAYLFPPLNRVHWSIPIIHASLLALAALNARGSSKRLGWAVNRGMFWVRSGWVIRRMMVARLNRVQGVSIKRSPFDRLHGTASLLVDTAGYTNLPFKVPFLPIRNARALQTFLAADSTQQAH